MADVGRRVGRLLLFYSVAFSPYILAAYCRISMLHSNEDCAQIMHNRQQVSSDNIFGIKFSLILSGNNFRFLIFYPEMKAKMKKIRIFRRFE